MVPDKKQKIKQLERSLRFATRTALGSPYRSDFPCYLTYDQRLLCLKLITIEKRHVIASICIAKKLLSNEMITALNPRTRNPNSFIIDRRRIPPLMEIGNTYSTEANIIDDTIPTIKTKLKLTFNNQRRIETGYIK